MTEFDPNQPSTSQICCDAEYYPIQRCGSNPLRPRYEPSADLPGQRVRERRLGDQDRNGCLHLGVSFWRETPRVACMEKGEHCVRAGPSSANHWILSD